MTRVHKSLRIDADLAAAVDALKADKESDSSAYARVLEAGVEALQREAGAPPSGGDVAVGALAATVEALTSQLKVKDEQIAALTRLTEQAQTLQAMQSVKAIESPKDGGEGQDEQGGFMARFRRFFS